MDTTATLQSLRSWPVNDRFELLCQLWDQIVEDGWQPTIDEDLAQELDRRCEKFDANPEGGITPKQLRESIRRLKA